MAVFLTPNTKFKPFSYQEMLAPVLAYKEAYDTADAELNTLLEDAATKGFAFAPQDVAEKEAYDNMMSKLKQASDNLASGNVNAFKDIRNLNKEYRKTMIPIQQKITKRAELAAEQRKLLSTNPNLRFTKDYSTESLSNINDSSTYNIIDLNSLYKNVAEEFASKTSTLYRDNIEPTPIGDTGYYNVTTGYGYTPDEFVEGLTDKNSDVYKFYKNKIDAIDSRTDVSSSIKDEMKATVLRGMEASSGTFKTSQIKGKSTNDVTSKMLKIGDNLYELSGALYQYDKDGNLYKIGEKPKTSLSNKGSSSSSGSGSSEKHRIGRPDNPITINFNKKGEVKTTKTRDLALGDDLGQLMNYGDLSNIEGVDVQSEVDKYIGQDETSNYNYYVNGREITIVPKKITITEPQTIDTEVE